MTTYLTPEEIELARERIKLWPLEDRRALTRMSEEEARVIMLATALLDIRPEGGEEAAGTAPVAEGVSMPSAPISEPPAPPPGAVLPYRANEHPTPAHEGAEKTVSREGEKHVVSPGSHRHKLLRCFAEVQRMTLIEAGHYALREHGVGEGTIIQWDEGRRRSSELAEFGLLDRVTESFYALNAHGRVALEVCDAGKRWKSSEHEWELQGDLF